jgi:hypothetical protein
MIQKKRARDRPVQRANMDGKRCRNVQATAARAINTMSMILMSTLQAEKGMRPVETR